MHHESIPRQLLLAALHRGGVDEALATLNARVPHRYTGIYRLHAGLLTSAFLFDKEGITKPPDLAVVPLDVSFCQFVFTEQFFRTDNSANDARLDGNPHQGVVVSYHGVPLLDARGEIFGSLCHFDMRPWGISDEEFANMQLASQLIPPFLPASWG